MWCVSVYGVSACGVCMCICVEWGVYVACDVCVQRGVCMYVCWLGTSPTLTPVLRHPPGEGSQVGGRGPEAAAAEPAVPGALRIPGALQRLPPPGEGRLLAEALQHLDAGGERQAAEAALSSGCRDPGGNRLPVEREAFSLPFDRHFCLV